MTQKPNNPVVQQVDDRPATAEALWQEMVEWDDRTSPEEYPEMAMLTFEEFADFLNRHRQATLEEAAKVALFDRSELEPFVSAAAVIWCGKKERETFVEDIAYFKHNWSSLPGLRAEVVATAILSMEKAS